MLLTQTQDALLILLNQIKLEIPQVLAVADGSETAELMRRYVVEEDLSVTLEMISTAKLINFVSK